MRKYLLFLFLLASGCGYTLKNVNQTPYKTIYIPTFQNKISIQADSPEHKLYYAGLEIELDSVLKRRFRYDGNILPVSRPQDADVILEGTILDYSRDALRYSSDEDIEEYRINIKTNIRLLKGDKQLWQEDITGDSTYFLTGPNAKTESEAIEATLEDLARRIVDRVVVGW